MKTNSPTHLVRISGIGLAISIFGSISFGLYPAAAQAAYSDGANWLGVLLVTTWARALSMLIFSIARGYRLLPSKQALIPLLGAGFCQAISVIGIIASLAFIPGPVTMTIVFTHTVMLLLYTVVRGEIRGDWLIFGTTLCALLGVSLVVGAWDTNTSLSVAGILLAFTGATATGIRLYMFGKQVQEQEPSVVGAQVFTVAAIILVVLIPFFAPHFPQSTKGSGWLAACALSLVLGSFGMLYGVRMLGSFTWSLFAKVEPVFTALFAYAVLGQTLAPSQYLGIAVVLGSLAIFQFMRK